MKRPYRWLKDIIRAKQEAELPPPEISELYAHEGDAMIDLFRMDQPYVTGTTVMIVRRNSDGTFPRRPSTTMPCIWILTSSQRYT